jgi:hypothetical protein
MNCPKHPKYQGKFPSKVACRQCEDVYKDVHPLETARASKKEHDTKLYTARTLKEALTHITELEAFVEAAKSLHNAHASTTILPREGTNTSEAVAVAVATDWHLGSVIKPETVNGLNSFDVAIGTERVKTFFERIVRFTEKERQDIKIHDLILFLGGDLIEGALHLDTIMSNEIAEPINQAILAQELIESGLNFLLNHGKYRKITVVCQDGNHGRITQKMHSSTRKGNALEYFMYYSLAKRFPKLNWVVGKALHSYLEVYDKVIRFHHGDTIGFGGVNGPYTYLNRRIYQWDEGTDADYSVQGHLHMYCVGTRRWLINGALVGHNAYAISLGGEYQPPIQAFFLFDKKRGPTVQLPILL